MGNITSSNFNNLSIINFDKMLDFIDSNCIIINTLNENLQSCLIYNTIHSSNEVQLLNKYLTSDLYIEIIIYGKNSSDISVFNKYKQLQSLGFKNIFIYMGGIFEWLLLQDIFGKEKFKTTSNELDILKFK